MRDVVKRVVAPKFIRYAKNGREAADFAYHSPKALPFSNKQVASASEHFANKALAANNITNPKTPNINNSGNVRINPKNITPLSLKKFKPHLPKSHKFLLQCNLAPNTS